jgi:pimeloyl-ACP methyl ester carboxylesterase
MDIYADDLAALVEALDLNNAIMVEHSTGGGEWEELALRPRSAGERFSLCHPR